MSPSELVRALVQGLRRDRLAEELDRMSDHLLADIGLRRDQIDPLRLGPAEAAREAPRPARRPAVRPSLQGCG